MECYYKIPSLEIIHDLLVDEIIIANLETGIYYSIRGIGILIWQLLLSGKTLNNIAQSLSQKYKTPLTEIQDGLNAFLAELINEKLLTADYDLKDEKNTSEDATFFYPEEYSHYVLEKYDEIKNLLLIDPIHAVGEQGWPAKQV
ncbi:MAG: PqqD family protein [Gammaproteobacteria bacterium]|nr:PqqD family protein [Gammaproteobacteria bacterium]